MKTITATVNWTNEGGGRGRGMVDDIIVPRGNGPTTIVWVCGPEVDSFIINGLDPMEFSPPTSFGPVQRFATEDADSRAGEFTYNVTAVHVEKGEGIPHDPKIINET